MLGRVGSGLLWAACSGTLLVASFGAVVVGIYALALALGSVSSEDAQSFQVLLTFYFKLVCFRGLLPCLALTLAFWPVVVRILPGVTKTRRGLLGGLAIAALPAYAIVAWFLLLVEIDGQTSIRMRTAFDHLATAGGIAGGAVLAAWIPRAFLPLLRPARD